MTQILDKINGFVWGIPTLLLILGCGVYLTVITGCVQVRFLPKALKNFFGKLVSPIKDNNGISSYQALCTALAATVGTGNLAGVAGAIAIGGPGAVFWMWISAFFGMVTKFAEATLAVHFRTRHKDGSYSGGPMHMILLGMGEKWRPLAVCYCFFGIAAAFGVGNATQINTVISGVNQVFTILGYREKREWNLLLGLVFAIIVSAMLAGGAKRIGRIAEGIVPYASAGYLMFGVWALFLNRDRIPQAFALIIQGAFTPEAVSGGVVGSWLISLRIGTSRGVFTNEAGLGTAAIAHAGANVAHPVEQGLMGIMEVFLDTVVICTVTALVILTGNIAIPYGQDVGIDLTNQAFATVFGSWISIPLAIALCAFAFATILGWGLYGIKCAQFLFGSHSMRPFVLLQGITVVIAAVLQTGTVWLLCEIVNGLMAIPNLIALLALSPHLRKLIKDYSNVSGSQSVHGGTYADIDQCKQMRTLSHEKISSSCCRGREAGKKDLPSEYRPAGS